MYHSTTYPSPLGELTLACRGERLVGLWLQGQAHFGEGAGGAMIPKKDLPVFDAAKEWLEEYFAGEKPAMDRLPLAPMGSEFRQNVWEILRRIPYGQVTTYGQIAREMAKKMNRPTMSSQAVGGAVGHNPLSILIPCHRVVGADGSLTGYAGGLAVKRKLLELEGVDLSPFFDPIARA